MYQLIISAIIHGLHYYTLNSMINNNLAINNTDYKSIKDEKTKNRLFYKLTTSKNKSFLKYKIIDFEGKYTDMIKLIQDTIIDDYETLKIANIIILNFNNQFTKELITKKLDITMLPDFEKMNCIINKNDLTCFLFNFFKKATLLKIIDTSFDIDDYENLYNYLIKENMYILADIVNKTFYLEKEKINYDHKKDRTYKKLVEYSFILLKI